MHFMNNSKGSFYKEDNKACQLQTLFQIVYPRFRVQSSPPLFYTVEVRLWTKDDPAGQSRWA